MTWVQAAGSDLSTRRTAFDANGTNVARTIKGSKSIGKNPCKISGWNLLGSAVHNQVVESRRRVDDDVALPQVQQMGDEGLGRVMRSIIAALVLVSCVSTGARAQDRREVAQAEGRAWAECVLTQAQQWALTSEPATVIAEAAFGQCLSQETRFREAFRTATKGWVLGTPADNQSIELKVRQFQEAIQRATLASILKARSSKAP